MKILSDIIRHHDDTEMMREDALGVDRPCAILTPIIPIRYDDADSWFGGMPRLPKDTAWPDQDGVPLRFASQINLARLPSGIWEGVGPREGWLAMFLHPETHAAKVLHVQGEIEERNGPGQLDASWARTYALSTPKIDKLPRWPVTIAESRHGPKGAKITTVGAMVEARLTGNVDLRNPAIHPFDKQTLSILLDALETFFIQQVKDVCRFPVMKKVRPSDLHWMSETRELAFQNLAAFYSVEATLVPCRYKFALEQVEEEIPKLAELPVYDFKYLKNDEEGYCCLEYRRTTRGAMPPPQWPLKGWWDRYAQQLYWHCVNAYTTNQESLHRALCELMEQIWRIEAEWRSGGMGHAPEGFIYTPHGPRTDTEVLLELPTSSMQGWIWGDCYSIVLLIKREALSHGDFSDIRVDITN
jgi:hypothetical protein